MKKLLVTIAAIAAISNLGSVAAAAVQLDGSLPMYPNATIDPKIGAMPADVIARGAPLVLLSHDSVQTVDAWYASHAPKACARSSASGGVKYACPGGSIVIYSHGGTQIAFVPAFPKF